MLTNVQVLAGVTSVARFDDVVVWFETGPQGGGAMLTQLLQAVQAVSSGSVPSRQMGARLAAVLNTGDAKAVPALVAATPEGQGLRVVVHGWGSVVADGIHVPNGWVDQVINDRRTFFLGRNTVSPLAPVEGSALDLEDGVVPGDGVSFALAARAASPAAEPLAAPAAAPSPAPPTPTPAAPPWAATAEPLGGPAAPPLVASPPVATPATPATPVPSPWEPSAAPVAAAPPVPASVPSPVEPPAYEPPPSDPPPHPASAPAPAGAPTATSPSGGAVPGGWPPPGPQPQRQPSYGAAEPVLEGSPTAARAAPAPVGGAMAAAPVPTPAPGWSQPPAALAPGRLVLDDGRSAVLERTCVLGSSPHGSPAVQTGVAMPLTVMGAGVAPVHVEIRVDPGHVSVRDLGSAPTYVLGPGEATWSPLAPGQISALAPGSRVAIGQRTISYERP